jgi:hypothetical protein
VNRAVAWRLCGSQLPRSRRFALQSFSLRPRAARLTALTARATSRSRQLSTAAVEVLDDDRQRRYSRIIFAGCDSRPPPHRPVWSTFESAVSGHGSFPLLEPRPGRLFVRRHVRETDNRIGLRFGPRPGADPTVHHTSQNHHAATAVRLSEVDASGDALSAPIHCEQQRHRRSEWAGVSWPTDDAHERDAAVVIGPALVQRTTAAASTAQTRRFARSFVPWRGRPHASASSWN